MMKNKIVYEDFDEKTGFTIVTIQNKYGRFTGTARCHPDDDYSMFQGERIAVTRANIKFCKFRIMQEKAKLIALNDFRFNYQSESDYDVFCDNFEVRKLLYQKKKVCKKTIEYFQDSISILKNSIKLMDEERQKVLLRSKKNK